MPDPSVNFWLRVFTRILKVGLRISIKSGAGIFFKIPKSEAWCGATCHVIYTLWYHSKHRNCTFHNPRLFWKILIVHPSPPQKQKNTNKRPFAYQLCRDYRYKSTAVMSPERILFKPNGMLGKKKTTRLQGWYLHARNAILFLFVSRSRLLSHQRNSYIMHYTVTPLGTDPRLVRIPHPYA